MHAGPARQASGRQTTAGLPLGSTGKLSPLSLGTWDAWGGSWQRHSLTLAETWHGEAVFLGGSSSRSGIPGMARQKAEECMAGE